MYTKQKIILRYYRESRSQRVISRELKISRLMVKKYIDQYVIAKKEEKTQRINPEAYLSSY
jgi:DNA-binding transcriptional regulator LsrR (DeoR family)